MFRTEVFTIPLNFLKRLKFSTAYHVDQSYKENDIENRVPEIFR